MKDNICKFLIKCLAAIKVIQELLQETYLLSIYSSSKQGFIVR